MKQQKMSIRELFRVARGKKTGCCHPATDKKHPSAGSSSTTEKKSCCQPDNETAYML
ncbi:MAG: hypothetical protein SCK57_10055 [Bacillota bacterium]|nr:hypothetical protein [Bacillota bacterium]MDW7677992.1 hypothetical protein [Bacillota bacterium]